MFRILVFILSLGFAKAESYIDDQVKVLNQQEKKKLQARLQLIEKEASIRITVHCLKDVELSKTSDSGVDDHEVSLTLIVDKDSVLVNAGSDVLKYIPIEKLQVVVERAMYSLLRDKEHYKSIDKGVNNITHVWLKANEEMYNYTAGIYAFLFLLFISILIFLYITKAFEPYLNPIIERWNVKIERKKRFERKQGPFDWL